MRIGFVGLGKLGMPCAVAMAARGHDVMGYDVNTRLMSTAPRVYKETAEDGVSDFNPRLAASTIRFGPLHDVIAHAEIFFVAVQTPHDPEFEGITPLSERRADFDYSFLVEAVREISQYAQLPLVVAVISTVLPGVVRKHVMPLLEHRARVAYNPYFISMGTAMHDFLHPEFVLCGAEDASVAADLASFYRTITDAPFVHTSVESAEVIKVTYNTYISTKIAFANTVMELCHKVAGADADEVTAALKLGNRRIVSGRYMTGGMGDGGGCHPRDNIAMSWLARELDLSFDWFENIMLARERQTAWLADLMEAYDLPKAICGYTFKSESNIVVGSPALLLKRLLEAKGHPVFMHDPFLDANHKAFPALDPMVFLIGVKHGVFATYEFPPGSVVIDPWRYLTIAQPGVRLVSVGRNATQLRTAAASAPGAEVRTASCIA